MEALDRIKTLGVVEAEVGWVLTVPAIWDDAAKSVMRQAAFEAGIVKDVNSPNLQLVLEPEAAIVACAMDGSSESLLEKLVVGTAVTVLDCGE